MRVSFNGIKNIGYTKFTYNFDNQEYINSPVSPNMAEEYNFLSLRLTNDKDGNDLSEYLKLIKDKPQFINSYNNDIICININKRYEHDEPSDIYYPEYDFQLNEQELELNDNNLKMFSFIGKILKKTKQMADNSHSKDIISTDFLTEISGSEGVKIMFDYLQNVMENYFNK